MFAFSHETCFSQFGSFRHVYLADVMKCRRRSYFGSSGSEAGPAEPNSVEAQAGRAHVGRQSSNRPLTGAPTMASPQLSWEEEKTQAEGSQTVSHDSLKSADEAVGRAAIRQRLSVPAPNVPPTGK